MNLEVKKDSNHTFNFPLDVFGTELTYKNQEVVITTATIEIVKATGEILEETNMSIDTELYSASYTWDSTDKSVDENYVVKFKINGIYYNRLFDIYFYPFQNTVTDNDLFLKDKSLKEACDQSGTADSGSTTYLTDSNRMEANSYFDGGEITLYFDDKIQKRNVTVFQANGIINFSPSVPTAVTQNTGYSVRPSFQDQINEAGKEVQERFQQLDRRPYLLVDHTQLKTIIIWQTLMNYYFEKRKIVEDEYDLKYIEYQKLVETYFNQTHWKYDLSLDGGIGDGEEDELTKVEWAR